MDINNMDQEIAHHAAHAVEVCQGKTVSKLDFSPDSLEPLQQYIVEASAGFAAMSDEQKSALVADLGSYVLEVARRNVGGAYAWFTKREQPVLVVGEPDYRVIFVAWDKVSSRLAGDVGAKIPFHYRLLLHHISQAKKDTSVLCVWDRPPNQTLQQTAAAILVPHDIKSFSAAAAAERIVRQLNEDVSMVFANMGIPVVCVTKEIRPTIQIP